MQVAFNRSVIKIQRAIIHYRLYHLLFWAIYILIVGITLPVLKHDLWGSIVKEFPIIALHMIVVYVNFGILVKRFLLTKNYLAYIVSAVLLVCAATFPIAILAHTIIQDKDFQSIVWSPQFLYLIALSIVFSLILTMLLKFLKQSYEDQQVSKELQRVQLETELKFLKAQINPHFLFNSLNNLYALTLKKSDLAPEVVLRLSDILRYVLYETQYGLVDFQKELQHLRDFVELEKIRIGDRVKIVVDLVEPPTDMKIEPMLYLTLVENAFKHGAQGSIDDSWVNIQGYPTITGYTLEIENSIPKHQQQASNQKTVGGIGLENLKKRLDLTYPEKHRFFVQSNENSYHVKLEIDLLNNN